MMGILSLISSSSRISLLKEITQLPCDHNFDAHIQLLPLHIKEY